VRLVGLALLGFPLLPKEGLPLESLAVLLRLRRLACERAWASGPLSGSGGGVSGSSRLRQTSAFAATSSESGRRDSKLPRTSRFSAVCVRNVSTLKENDERIRTSRERARPRLRERGQATTHLRRRRRAVRRDRADEARQRAGVAHRPRRSRQGDARGRRSDRLHLARVGRLRA